MPQPLLKLSPFVPDANEPFIDLVHVIYPEDVYVAPDVVLDWAHDALVNESLQDHVNAHGPITDDKIHEAIAAGVSRLTDLAEAQSILSDLGTHTFARF